MSRMVNIASPSMTRKYVVPATVIFAAFIVFTSIAPKRAAELTRAPALLIV